MAGGSRRRSTGGLHREQKYRRFFFRGDRGVYVPLDSGDGIIRSRVLPGFWFRAEEAEARKAAEEEIERLRTLLEQRAP